MQAASAVSEVRAAALRLREAGTALRRRPRAEVVAVLGALLERLRDRTSAIRARLAAELPAATGFHPATLAAGLEAGFAPWTGEAFAALVRDELGAGAERVVSGFPLTGVVLGGAIPMPSVLQLLAPLALGSPVLVRPGSHDGATARAVARELGQLDPALGACLEVVSFAHGDAGALAALAEADCVVGTGSDDAVAAIAAHVRPWQRFVGYGHRCSVAALGRAGDLAEHCAGLARDVALWDQLGCLSPIALVAIGWQWGQRSELLDQLESSFAKQNKALPIGVLAPEDAAKRANVLATFEMRAARGEDAELRSDPGRAWSLLAERELAVRGSPLYRVLRVHFAPDASAFDAWLAPISRHLACAGLGGFAPEPQRQLAHRLAARGASRVCALGQMQAPPISWSHDGQGVLVPLARLTDLDFPAK